MKWQQTKIKRKPLNLAPFGFLKKDVPVNLFP